MDSRHKILRDDIVKPIRLYITIFIAVVAAMLLAGCTQKATPSTTAEIGRSVYGRPIQVITLGTGPEHILFGASIHGNEWAGTPLLYKLLQYVSRHPQLLEGRTISFIPVMNPDGYHFNTRGNAHGVDLNRNFPATNRQNSKRYGPHEFSEPESRAWFDYITRFAPSRMIIMHQPYDIVDWDGPGEPLARHMARHAGMKAERVGGQPGSMGSHYGMDKGLPIITFELPRNAQLKPFTTQWNTYGRALVSAIAWPNGISLAEFHEGPRWDLLAPPAILAVSILVIAAGSIIMSRKHRL